MSHDTAVWILLACLLAAALLGFGIARALQLWHPPLPAAAGIAEEVHARLQVAHEHLAAVAEQERQARVVADQRGRALSSELAALQGQLEAQAASLQHTEDGLARARQDLVTERARQTAIEAQLDSAQQAAATLQQHLDTTHAAALAALVAKHAADLRAQEERLLQAALPPATQPPLDAAAAERATAQLRAQLGQCSERVLDLEQALNRLQLEKMGLEQEAARALADAGERAARAEQTLAAWQASAVAAPGPQAVLPEDASAGAGAGPDTEDRAVQARLAAQRLQELEEQLRRARLAVSNARAETTGLKARIVDLEARLLQLFQAGQPGDADTTAPLV